ncbi:hypothetical protein [Marinoscillum furvescens]|uniref:Uncharacterized protein n=1 Tax=Marinoscillum furvescens DSM 4134 TaxID=1122208 RepID=A0A3D9LG65_MARFU|nr:hypothetical protein [Marinoscillum furvescens]REE05628.1 hypothetical protein C7460_101145 [Marinoscillum furvescens DSM 4134]
MKTLTRLGFLLLFAFAVMSCEDEPELTASVSINETGSDLGGDVTGNGGSATESYTWTNNLTTVDYNMDITAAQEGSFQLQITDADGKVVLNQTLTSGVGDDSKSGVSQSGTAGEWTVEVILKDFKGDGSFSISPGD